MARIHAIILTLNEERHIARAIESVRDICETVLVVDSGSTDRTVEIAAALGAEVVSNEFRNYARQFNFGIDQMGGREGWFLRLDADEYVHDDAATALPGLLDGLDDDIDGVCLRRRMHFLGRWIRHGGVYPVWALRIWRAGRGRCENRWMDEHIRVTGGVHYASLDFSDDNGNSIAWWTDKHNRYASREVIDILSHKYGLGLSEWDDDSRADASAARRRFVKENIYNRMPPALRSSLYFLYRYIVRLGFLDGREGFYFHFLQAYWYRTLVDAKVEEIERLIDGEKSRLGEVIFDRTGIDLRDEFTGMDPIKQ